MKLKTADIPTQDAIHSLIRYLILAGSIWFLWLGVLRQEHLTVLAKATHICLECIGVG